MQTETPAHTPTTVSADIDPWLTIAQGATHVHVHQATLRREMSRGRLRYARVGGWKAIRLPRSWLDNWLEASSTPIEVR